MASRFQKKGASQIPSIPGTKPSLFNYQLLTGSGIPGLDLLVGGGLPLGTVTLVEDTPASETDAESGQNYAQLLVQYFLSEGAFHRHELFLGHIQPVHLFASVSNAHEEKNVVAQDDEQMKIAWRYKNQAPKTEELTSGKAHGHHFNLNKVVKEEELNLQKWTIQPDQLDNSYNRLFKAIQISAEQFVINPKKPPINTPSNLLRIGLVDILGNAMMGPEDMLTFLYRLRALARTHLLVIVISLSGDFFAKHEVDGPVHRRVKELVDFVLDLTAFSKAKRSSSVFKDYHGLIELTKASPLNCLVNSANINHVKSKHLFKSLRTKFSISPMHLPPELEKEVVKETAGLNLNKLEF